MEAFDKLSGMTFFEVWAPDAATVELELPGASRGAVRTLQRGRGDRDGWWELEVAEAVHGTDYSFAVDGVGGLPDPRSRWQPQGVLGPSRVFDPERFDWTDHGWRGVPLAGAVLYELHVGTFTPAGTFDAAIERLDALVELGVDAVQVLPVAAFPGRHGWGYDGAHLYAVHDPYGGPAAFQRFVDACHARGLAVVLDVVYNHLGPTGNRLSDFGPYFTDRHTTPWGAGINLDDNEAEQVRQWILGNTRMWFTDFHLDGLRLDAVHELKDDSAVHILEQLAAETEALATATGRPLFLIAESDLNDPRMVTAREGGGLGMTAQWNDDLHHALHAALTGESQGYYADFASFDTLARTYTEVFLHAGTWSSFRGRYHGRAVDRLRTPGYRFIAYSQNHDQIGNRALGDRLSGEPSALSPGLLRTAAALVLTSPFTPMLFMGEEWGAATPWRFFTDHQDPLIAEATREGRRREFGAHGWHLEDVPDPQDPATYERSKLDWSEREQEPHAGLLAWYRELIALRKAWPELSDPRLDRVVADFDEYERWLLIRRGRIRVAANLSIHPVSLLLDAPVRQVLLASATETFAHGEKLTLPPESVAIVTVG